MTSASVYQSHLLKPSSAASITMRAILLLCLLEVVSVQAGAFSWSGPGQGATDEGVNPNAESACLTDQASCGCCPMQQQIHRMKKFFNMTISVLDKALSKTNTLTNVTASRSAFSVALTNSDKKYCFGPFRDDKLITYKHVFINLGDGYSVETGTFTVPRSGVYSLVLTVNSDAGSPGFTCASLLVNSQVVAGKREEENMQDQEDSATIVVALHLNAGDRVAVNLPIGCSLCDDGSHYNTFTGFLLYPTD